MSEVVRNWNEVMFHLGKAMVAWKRYGDAWQVSDKENLPMQMQRWSAALHPGTPYAHVVPILHSAIMTRGGYEAQMIELVEEEKGEKDDKESKSGSANKSGSTATTSKAKS